jgi:hypothetical protein
MVTAGRHARLLDFGLARVAPSEAGEKKATTLTQQGAVFGTPGAMFPEQALGRALDRRSDVFSFGSLRPGLPGALVAVVDKALRRDPDERHHVSARPDEERWDGMEYFDPRTGKGIVFVFRGGSAPETSHDFVLKGLERARQYEVWSADGSLGRRRAGGNLPIWRKESGRSCPRPGTPTGSSCRKPARRSRGGGELGPGAHPGDAFERAPVRGNSRIIRFRPKAGSRRTGCRLPRPARLLRQVRTRSLQCDTSFSRCHCSPPSRFRAARS